MKKTAENIIIASIFVLLVSCSAGKNAVQSVSRVYHLGDSSTIVDGSLIYALPMTTFNVTVEFERMISIPGPYSRFAGDMLGLKDVITTKSELWSVTGITVTGREEIDPSEYYVIESNSVFIANALKLKRSGLILDVNPALYAKYNRQSLLARNSIPDQEFSDLGSDEYFISQNDTVYRTVKLDTAFVKIPYLVEMKKILTQEQLAEKAAKALLELRDGKHSILSGEANIFPQSSAGIDEINRMEKEYTALFTGKTITEKKTITYTVIPGREAASKPTTLFRFSATDGVLPLLSASGIPVVAEFEPARKTRDITIIPRTLNEGEKVQNYDKLYYRLPDVATIRIKMDSQVLYESRKLVDQFGEVLQLPSNYIIGN
ncbi:MAG: DUF4831 family protein [Bacteroidales bacterium]